MIPPLPGVLPLCLFLLGGVFFLFSGHFPGKPNRFFGERTFGVSAFRKIIWILAIFLIILAAANSQNSWGDMAKGIKSFKAGINEKDEDNVETAKTIENTTSASVSAESKDKDSVKS